MLMQRFCYVQEVLKFLQCKNYELREWTNFLQMKQCEISENRKNIDDVKILNSVAKRLNSGRENALNSMTGEETP